MNTQKTIPLVIAYGENEYEQVKALIDGTVVIDGCSMRFVPLTAGEMLFRSFEDPQFNVAELSLSNYVTRRAQGDCPYLAMPAYVFRSFPHSNVYVRTDRGIQTPGDLCGRRIGIAAYQNTSQVWVRGMLEDEYGVHPSDIQWICVSNSSNARADDARFEAPPGVAIEHVHTAKTLSEMLEDGEMDALISAQAPRCFTRGSANVDRLFADYANVEDAYFRRTGIFPIFHIMGVKAELANRHPWLAQRLFKAFVTAKNIALAEKNRAAALPSATPALTAEVVRMTRLMGDDYHSYGLGERDCNTLELFLRYHVKQGLSNRISNYSELFSPVPVACYRT